MGIGGSLIGLLNVEAAAWARPHGHACLGGNLFLAGVWAVCRLAPRLPAALRACLWWLACLKLCLDLCGLAPLTLPVLPASASLRISQLSSTPHAPGRCDCHTHCSLPPTLPRIRRRGHSS